MNREQLRTTAPIALLMGVVVASIVYLAANRDVRQAAVSVSSPSAVSSVAARTLSPTPSPQSTRLFTSDVDPFDASNAWILLTTCGGLSASEACRYFVAHTTDGAHSWTQPVQVGPAFSAGNGDAPRAVQFVNTLDGFVWGYGGAYVTHDGGQRWDVLNLLAIGQELWGIVVRGQTVWAVSQPCGRGDPCQSEVRSSLDGGRTWTSAHRLPTHSLPDDILPLPTGLLVSTYPSGEMEITSDMGVTWRSIKSRCVSNSFPSYTATLDGVELWQVCLALTNPATGDTTNKILFVSEDGGRSWSQRAKSQGGSLPESGTSAWLISQSRHNALFRTDRTPVISTHDSGATWMTMLTGIDFRVIHFAGPNVGWGLDAYLNFWVTTDGGGHWAAVSAYSSTLGAP